MTSPTAADDPADRPARGPAPLPWGWRYLMCPPRHFELLYEINPWMHREVTVDLDAAQDQWEALAATLRDAGAGIEVLDPVPGLPDLVFTANAGVVNGDTVVVSSFRHPERRGEADHDAAWFRAQGFEVHGFPEGVAHEGAGDALAFGRVLLSAYRLRSDVRAHTHLSAVLGVPVRSIELVDPRLYHLDLTFCPLDDRRAMVAPLGWDRYGREVVRHLVPEPLVLEDDEALAFTANSVVVGDRVVMPACPPRVGRQLEAWGFEPVECRLGEFLKAGGGCRCLTLALDVRLPVSSRRVAGGRD